MKNLKSVSAFNRFQWLPIEGKRKKILESSQIVALLVLFRWLPIRGMFAVWMMKTICEFY